MRSNSLLNLIDEEIFGKYSTGFDKALNFLLLGSFLILSYVLKKDFKSLRSYWENIYSINDVFKIQKVESLIAYLVQITIERILAEINAIKNNFYYDLYDFKKFIDLFSNDRETSVQELNWFIEDDLFKGYVLRIKFNQKKFKEMKFEYEAYFRVNHKTIIFDRNEWSFFLRNIKEITLCSEFTSAYPKKLDKCTGSLIGQNDDPEFVIKFNRKFYLSFKLEIAWLNPNGCVFQHLLLYIHKNYL